MNPEIAPLKLLVAGAGYGGLETALALKDTLGERVEITLLTATVNSLTGPSPAALRSSESRRTQSTSTVWPLSEACGCA